MVQFQSSIVRLAGWMCRVPLTHPPVGGPASIVALVFLLIGYRVAQMARQAEPNNVRCIV